MTVKNLRKLLESLPDEMHIELYHQIYNGGEHVEHFDDFELRLYENLRVAFLIPERLDCSLYTKTVTIDELLN